MSDDDLRRMMTKLAAAAHLVSAELKMLGNGVCPQQAALALRLLDER